MVHLLNVLLPSLLLLIHGVQSYCVYNYFTDNSTVNVRQRMYGIPLHRRFYQDLNPGDKACCSYTNPDCSPRNEDNDNNSFEVFFKWPRYTSERHLVECVSGGGLSFHGSETDYWAQCSEPSGVVTRVPITPAAVRS